MPEQRYTDPVVHEMWVCVYVAIALGLALLAGVGVGVWLLCR